MKYNISSSADNPNVRSTSKGKKYPLNIVNKYDKRNVNGPLFLKMTFRVEASIVMPNIKIQLIIIIRRANRSISGEVINGWRTVVSPSGINESTKTIGRTKMIKVTEVLIVLEENCPAIKSLNVMSFVMINPRAPSAASLGMTETPSLKALVKMTQ